MIDILGDESLDGVFREYLPPLQNFKVRAEEVKAIRNRVAHFRDPHSSDVDRIELFARDLVKGIQAFCERVVSEYRDSSDEVVTMISNDWENTGYRKEIHTPNGWLYATGPSRHDPSLHGELSISRSPVGNKLYLMRATVFKSSLNVSYIIDSLSRELGNIIYTLVPDEKNVFIMVSGITAPSVVASIANQFWSSALASMVPDSISSPLTFADFPDTVLGPDHLLTRFVAYGPFPLDGLFEEDQ